MHFLDLPFIESGLRILMAFLCQVIYPIIGFMYELFSNVSKINILSGAVEPIYQRVTLILTIVMVFYITFQFVKYVVQPDTLTDKEKGAGNIIYKAIIVVALIAFIPTIFEMAYKIQGKIIDTNVISKVILGPQASTNDDNLGSAFSSTIFGMFYYVDEEYAKKNCHDGTDCQTIVDNNIYNLSTENSLSSLNVGLNATEKKGETPLITFDGLLAVIFGGFILYILILYCVDVGVRWVQLIYLQIIAPIPIIGYLSPKKDGIFQKWTKQCFTTYLDLFLRVAIINIVLLLCDTILKAKSNLDQTGGLLAGLGEVSGMMETLIYIVLIMGVMLFAHKAPKMLAELFPKAGAASGNFGLKATERVAPEVARVAGAALGSTRFLGGAAARGINRHIRNKANGAESILTKKGRQQAKTRQENRARASQMAHDFRATQRLHSRVSNEEMNEGKLNVQRAKTALEEAKKTGDRAQIEKAEANLKKEAGNYRQLMQRRNDSKEIQQMKQNIKNSNDELQRARKEKAEAEKTGDQTKIAEAAKKVDNAEKKLNFHTGRFNSVLSGDIDKSQANLEQANWQVAKDENERYGSVLGEAAWGALSGAATGAKEGFKAKKLEEIIPKATEGWKKDVKNVQELNKYYDNGGAVGIQGTIDRTITQVEKSMGIDTEYAKTMMSTKPLETKIKDLDAKMTLTKDVSSTVGSGEDRLKSKVSELKAQAKANTIKTGLTDNDGHAIYAEVREGETIGELTRRYDALAEVSKNEAEAATKRAEEAEKNGITGDALESLKKEATEKSIKAQNDKFASEQIKKNAARNAYTQILQSGKDAENNKNFDQVAVQNIRDAQRSIRLASQEPELRNKVVEKLISTFGPVNGQKLAAAFISGNITTFEDMDDIKTAVINVQNEFARDKKDFQERKRQIETSELAQAQKAANDYSGNSGK